jgi:hypothetical protein
VFASFPPYDRDAASRLGVFQRAIDERNLAAGACHLGNSEMPKPAMTSACTVSICEVSKTIWSFESFLRQKVNT